MSAPIDNILVIGLGNPDRGDDGIGPLVARKLIGKAPRGARVIARTGDALALIEDWAGADAVVLIDAAATVSRAGCIHRICATAEALARELPLSSTHAFGLADAVDLARALHALPPHLVVFAVEGACFEPGAVMTREVFAAADKAAALVLDELRSLGAERGQADA